MLLHLFRPIPALSPLAPPRARLQNPQATKQRGTPINSVNHKHDGPHWLIFMDKASENVSLALDGVHLPVSWRPIWIQLLPAHHPGQ